MTLPLVLSCAEQSPEQFTKLGDKAPAFSLSDVDGEMISLADYRGKIVILDFGATWCKPCKEAAPVLEGIYRKYGDRGVVVIGINMETGDYAREAVKSFITENEITYPMLMDDGQVSRRYFIVRIPTTYILDRNLNAAGEIAGFPPGYEERLVAEIEKLLSAKNE